MKEMNFLRSYLEISYPFPLKVSTSHKEVRTRILLCGDQGILLLIFNSTAHSNPAPGEAPFQCKTLQNVTIEMEVQAELVARDVQSVETGLGERIDYQLQEEKLALHFKTFTIVEKILIQAGAAKRGN